MEYAKCARCGGGEDLFTVSSSAAGNVIGCMDCENALKERIRLVREGWYSPPLTEEEVVAWGKQAREAGLRGDTDGWIRAITEYCRAVIYRERDDPPEFCLANYVWGIVWSSTRDGMDFALRKAAGELVETARVVGVENVVGDAYSRVAERLLEIADKTREELKGEQKDPGD